MKKTWIITRRELNTFFDSPMAYILIIAFLGLTGFFTWLYGADIFLVNQASLQTMFGVTYWTLFLFIPALTMRLFAEERRSGTLELLLTKPITDLQVVLGKFLATWILIAITLAMTFPYYITVSALGPVDHGAIISGYLGLLLVSGVYIGIGIFTSAISSNQMVGFLLAWFIIIFFHLIFDILAVNIGGSIGFALNYLSVSTHYESLSRGVIDSKDILYLLSLMLATTLGTMVLISRRNRND